MTVRGAATAASQHPGARRADRLALALLVLGSLVSLAWLVHPYHEANADTNDAAMYVLSAKSLLAGEGYTYLGRPSVVRPPGLSVLIAPLIAWRGVDFYALNLLVSLTGVALVAGLFLLNRPRMGTWLAFLVSALIWLNPAVRRFSNQVMSDIPGAALVIGCLLLERWASRRPQLAREIVLGVAIALAAYVRTVGILLVPAILAARVIEELASGAEPRGWIAFARQRALPFALTAAVLLVPWSVRNARAELDPPVDQHWVHSYSTAMWHVDPGDPSSPRFPPSAILARVPVRGTQMLSLLGSRLQTQSARLVDAEGARPATARANAVGERIEGSPWHWLAGALLILIALWMLVRKRRASEFLLAANAGLVAIYFGFQDRLVLLPFLLCVPLAVELAHELGTRWIGARASTLACAAALLAVIAVDFDPRPGWTQIERHEREVREFCVDVSRRVPADDALAASVGWHYALFLDRPVYSLLFAIRRESGAGFQQVVRKYAIDTVIGAPFGVEERAIVEKLRELPRSQPTVHGGVIVRVRE